MKIPLVKLSIIIPVYNSIEYLEACLSSVKAQSLREIEIVVVDDGSTDGSWSVIQYHASKDSRIRAIQQRNQGVSAARNTALKVAEGEYVGFVDSDDTVDTGYFEGLYNTAMTSGADIVSGYVDTEGEGRRYFYNKTNKRTVERDKCLLMGVVWLNVYRSSMLTQNNILFPANLRTAEDNLFNLQASYYANNIVSVEDDAAVYHHVVRDGSLTTQQYSSRNLLLLSRAILETVNSLNLLDKYSQEAYILRVLDTVNYFHQRFVKADDIDRYTRYRISIMFVRIWRNLKYRQQLLKAVREKDIDIEDLVHGKLMTRMYERYVVRPNSKVKKIKSRKLSVGKMKVLLKRAAKAILPHGMVVGYKRRLTVAAKDAPDEKKIAIVAAYKETKYVELLKQSVRTAGFKATIYPGAAKYVWLHWYENGIHDYDDFLRKLSMIKAWKDQGKKIILHIHNKKPHESPVPNLSHALMTALCDSADHVSIMSTETKSLLEDIWYYGDDFSQVSTVLHPNYIDAYGKKLSTPDSLKDDTLKILFFGLVRPYKGIENLLEATDGLDNVEISIFGNPKDDEYVAKLKSLCVNRDNVKFRFEFIPDEDIPQIFADHHIVALPYSVESSLNSGAAILALSYARTVVGTNNGTLKELSGRDVYFGYDYEDERDHVHQLRESIRLIQSRYDGKYNELLKVGDKAFQLVKKENSVEVIAESIEAMVRRIG